MEPNLYQLPFSGSRIISELSKEETIYISTIIPVFMEKELEKYKSEIAYNNFKKQILEGNPLTDFIKQTSLSEIRESISKLVQAKDFFSLEELKKCTQINISGCANVIKLGIYSVVKDEYLELLINNYVNCDKYENIVDKITAFLGDSIDYPSVSLVALLMYLDENKEAISGYEEKVYCVIFTYYTEHIVKSIKQKPKGYTHEEFIEIREQSEQIQLALDKAKEELRVSKEENRQLKKLKGQFSDILKELNDNINKKHINYAQVFKEAKEFKYDVLENTYKSTLSNLTTQIADLKAINKELRDKIKDLSETNEELNLKLKENEFNIVSKENDLEEVASETIEPEVQNKIGYCEIIDNVHYATLLDGTKQELLNIPERVYLANNQFVLIDNEGKFLHSYSYYKNTNILGSINLGVIRELNGQLVVQINEKRTDIRLPEGFNFKDGQIVGFDGYGNMKVLFKYVRGSLDFFINSIKAKGHSLYFVLKKLSNGIMIRDIFKNEEKFINDILQEEVEVGNILFIDGEGNHVRTINNSKYYTMSSLYQYKSYAVVVDINGEFYCKKQDTGEVLKINSSERQITDGDLVVIDEFVNVLSFADSEMEQKQSAYQKQKKRAINVKEKLEEIETKHRVLILGNISYENSYKLSFYKRGYHAEVIDGYSPYYKISSALKNVDYAIVIGGYTAHDNMWQIKEEAIPVIFPKTDGANSVLDEFETALAKFEEKSE